MMQKINVTRSLLPNRKKFDAYVDQIFDSARLTNYGPLVQELEQRLQDYLGTKNIVLVTNGTLALQVAYKLLGLQGEVITTPFTFVATSSSLVWEGLDVVYADIDQETFNLAPGNIEAKITVETSAIVPVHVFGNPCEVEKIQAIAEKHGLKVIYDASHAFGVSRKGESLLGWGDISTLSFHATKLFHTIEGGALIIKDDELCQKARKMINFGLADQDAIELLGINAKMNEFQAAMGLSLLDDMPDVIARREILVGIYDEIFKGILTKQKWSQDTTSNNGYYPILLESEELLVKVQQQLNEQSVYPRRYFCSSLDEVQFLSKSKQPTPVSQSIARRILCLPLYDGLTNERCVEIGRLVMKAIDK